MTVPFQSLSARANADCACVVRMLAEVVASDAFILKAQVASFERQLADRLGAPYAVAVASGTDAIKLGLAALGVGRGDEVLVPAYAFTAAASAPTQLGARVVFADVDPHTGTLTPAELESHLTPATKAAVIVHQSARLADMPALRAVADRHSIALLEDAAVSFGARAAGRAAGLWGDTGAISFFPFKPLGGFGEGGMIVTADSAVATRCRMLRNHGQDGVTRFRHHLIGFNSRMDEVQALYLGKRLGEVEALLRRRAALAARYTERLAALAPQVSPPPSPGPEAVHYTYVVETEDRDALEVWLAREGIETDVPLRRVLPLQPAYAEHGHRPRDFPNAERLCDRTLALPFYPEMPDAHVDLVAAAMAHFFAARQRPTALTVRSPAHLSGGGK